MGEKDGELKPIKSFTALVAVQEHPGVLKPGYCPVVFSRTAKVACKMTKILWKMGKKTGGAKVEDPPELSQFENAEVEFEPIAKCAALGRFAVMDSNRLKMLGKVSDVTHVALTPTCSSHLGMLKEKKYGWIQHIYGHTIRNCNHV